MPSLAWPKRDLEAEASVGRDSFARSARHRCCHGAAKILVRIGGAEPLPRLGPLRGDLAAAHNVAWLDLEDVGEVAAEGDLELEPHRFHAVVGDVEIFVQAAADRSAYREAQSARSNRTVLGEDGFVSQENAGRVIADRTAVQ